ncbi:MAG: phosphoribosylformylglycinamidine synthase subunit PurL [Candidatus Acidiferrales bacterium]
MLQTEVKVTPEMAAEHGLTAEEYARVRQILGRDPNITELGIFSVMWSEHCSYKSSKVHLKRLPTKGPQVLQGPGENAGVVDIGDGLCAAFKIESHNHPSFVEPFQGAATGVGGILRDIFTMGARPIAVLNSLRFGPITDVGAGPRARPAAREEGTHRGVPLPGAASSAPTAHESQVTSHESRETAQNRRILDGVVRGIAHYGNCFGVPTVGGEVMFEPCYSANPLVNALALGIARKDELFFARARGAGNPVIYVGAKTGRDGIHGASLLASAEFTEESQQKRPNVQVGDPFMEKLLLEACLEAMQTGAVVAIQDMGAAGLTCSTCEMGSRGGTGIEIELAKVPQRETGMTPYEIMLSESQERMLLVAERGREREVLDIFAKWGLDAVEIGRVTDDGLLRVRHHGEVVAEIPAHPLAEEGPVYNRPVASGQWSVARERLIEFADVGAGPRACPDLTENFRRLLASPAIASKRWIFQQYDHMVQTNTLLVPGAADAAVVRVKGTPRALALSTDGNGRWCYLAPRVGAMYAVCEAARNVACAGARPIAATNCLNFGSPEKPEVMWQFSEVIDGIAEACAVLNTPITGGNVSFYNETLGRSIYPTPVIGMLGVLEDAARAVGMAFCRAGDVIVLLEGQSIVDSRESIGSSAFAGGTINNELSTIDAFSRTFSSSEYAKVIHGIVAGTPPEMDLVAEKHLIECLVEQAAQGVIGSAHDVSDGGLAVTLAECCFAAGLLGVETKLEEAEQAPPGENGGKPPHSIEPPEMALFGERGARAVVSCDPAALAQVQQIARKWSVRARAIGHVTQGDFRIQLNGATVIEAAVDSLREVWATALKRALQTK